MKTNKLFLTIGIAFLFVGANIQAQQTDNGTPYHFKRAWAYNWTNNAWALQGRIIPTYDNTGKAIKAIAQVQVAGNWITAIHHDFVYNSKGQDIEELDSQFNGSTFLPDELDSMWYNTDGTLQTKIVYKPNNGKFAPWNRHNYKYANGNKLISEDFQEEWLPSTNTWGNDDDYFYSYNGSNSIIQILDKNWQANTWVVDHRDTMNFNAQGAVAEVVHQDTGAVKGTWVNIKKTVFDTATNASISQVFVSSVHAQIYPNPAIGNVILRLDNHTNYRDTRLVLTNISGSVVKQVQVNGDETTIETNGLAPGIYMYNILSNEGILTNGKLVIR